MHLLLVVLVAGLLGGGAESLSGFFHELGNSARQAKASLTDDSQDQRLASNTCRRQTSPAIIPLSQRDYPLVTRHIRKAWRDGFPQILNLRRDLAAENQQRVSREVFSHYGFDNDLWPIAASRQAQGRVSVVQIPSRENRQAGLAIKRSLDQWCNGQRFRIRIEG